LSVSLIIVFLLRALLDRVAALFISRYADKVRLGFGACPGGFVSGRQKFARKSSVSAQRHENLIATWTHVYV
jgi:hypothetical protein